ncbi:hypothetical protein SOVF_086160, partial [Spinacia oleracea]
EDSSLVVANGWRLWPLMAVVGDFMNVRSVGRQSAAADDGGDGDSRGRR